MKECVRNLKIKCNYVVYAGTTKVVVVSRQKKVWIDEQGKFEHYVVLSPQGHHLQSGGTYKKMVYRR